MPDTSPRILVIERDHDSRNLVCDILGEDGYRVSVTENWLDPEDVRQLRPAAMLLDPFVDGSPLGWEYLRLLRTQPGMRRLPVVVCVADHESLRQLTATELALASTVILKPLDPDELLETISALTRPSEILAPLPWPGRSELGANVGDD